MSRPSTVVPSGPASNQFSENHLSIIFWRFKRMRLRIMRISSPVVRAIRADDVVKLQDLMQVGYLLSEKYDDNSLLHVAATFKSVSVVNFLLTQSAIDINDRNREGWTALFLASTHARSQPVIDKLLSAGADATLPDRYDITILDYLLNCPNLQMVAVTQRLLETLPNGHLHVAVLSDPQLLSALIRDGADVNAQLGSSTPLHLAASMAREAAVELLLAGGADVNARNMLGSTPLHLAYDRDLSIVRKLIDAGADLELRDVHGRTVLQEALGWRRHAMAALLVEAGADLDCLGEFRATLLHAAVADPRDGGLRLARLLVERGADVDATTPVSDTPLHAAAKAGNLEGAAWLLYHGADPQQVNRYGCTPFMVALVCQHVDVQELLLDYEYDFNRRTKAGESLLALAAWSPLMWEIIDRGGVLATYYNTKGVDMGRKYQKIFEQTGHEKFPAGEHDNLIGFAVHYGMDDLFSYAMESEQLPAILEDAYSRRSQGLLTVHNSGTLRGAHHPAIEGFLEFLVKYFDYEDAAEYTYILLSHGYEPDYLEAYEFFRKYGRSPIFDFLLDMDLMPHIIPRDCLLPSIILDVTHSVKEHVDCFRWRLTPIWAYYTHEVNIPIIPRFLTNADLFRTFKEGPVKCSQCFKVPQARTMPSLQELSRDTVRDSVCAMRHITSYGDLRKHVKSLHVGPLWKLIMFRKPLY